MFRALYERLLALTAGLLWRRSASEGAQLRALALQMDVRSDDQGAPAAPELARERLCPRS